jgi:hypothetical protein
MFRTLGDPRSEDQLPPYPREIDSHPHYKYPHTSRFTLVEIFKALIHILPRTYLSIRVGPAGTPDKHPYRPSLFCRESTKNFLEACAANQKLSSQFGVVSGNDFSFVSHDKK